MPDKILVKGMVVPCASFGCKSRFAGTFTPAGTVHSVLSEQDSLYRYVAETTRSVLFTSEAQCPSDSDTLCPRVFTPHYMKVTVFLTDAKQLVRGHP